MTRAKIETAQLLSLNALLRAILPRSRFYAKQLARRGVVHRFKSLTDFRTRVPFTTKTELVADQAAHPPFGTNRTFPLDRYTRFHQTSGTTGQPLRWLDTRDSWDWMVNNWVTVFRMAGVRRGDRIFFAFSFGPFIGFWLAFDAAQKLDCLCIPAGGMSSAARLRAILDNGATILCCTPTYALRLAEVAREEKISLDRSRVRTIIVAGESGGSIPAVRSRISRAWNDARIFDHSGMTEVGPVTYEINIPSPRSRGEGQGEGRVALAVLESSYIAEIIGPKSMREVADGEVGELVLTPLGRTGMPLLRYRTGDLVKKTIIGGQLCLDGGILGRADDMVIVRGVNLFPSAIEDVVRRFPEVAEYRVEIRQKGALAEAKLKIEPVARCRDSDRLAQRLESALRSAFNLRIPVAILAPGKLPRFEMKAKRWVKS